MASTLVVAFSLFLVAHRQLAPGNSTLRLGLLLGTPLCWIGLAYGLAAGIMLRRPLISATAAIGMGLALLTMSPQDAFLGCRAEPDASDDLIIASINVNYQNADPRTLDGLMESSIGQPDILLIVELSTTLRDDLRPLLAERYPYQLLRPRHDGANGIGVYSRWPLRDNVETRLGWSASLETVAETPEGLLHLIGVHLTAPIGTDAADDWHRGLARLSHRAQSSDGLATVMLGDFNASGDHKPMRSLLAATGARDALDVKGCGTDATWPADRLLPPVSRLDHILVNDRIDVLEVQVEPAAGSDHRSVAARIRVRPG